jgi:hypothetical protein
MDGGSTERGIPEEAGGPSVDLLMGFLSDFRSSKSPPPKPQPEEAQAAGSEHSLLEAAALPAPSCEVGSAGEPDTSAPDSPPAWRPRSAGAPAWQETNWQPPNWQPPNWQPPNWQPPNWQPPAWQPPAWQPTQGEPQTGYWQPPAPARTAYGTPEPRSRRGPLRRVIVAALAAVAIVATAVVLVDKNNSSPPSYPAAWDPRVAPIAAFVQTQRGLTWKHPVKVEFLPPAKFNALMAKENAPSAQASGQAQTIFDVMRAVGVASGNVDLAKSTQQFAQSDVVGQYVDSDRTVYVSGDQLTPYVRSVLAHELTHALQAQYFDLQKMRSGHADDDSAVTALIEGDAVRVQDAYEQTLSQSDQSLLAQEEQQGSSQANAQNSQHGIPQFLVDQAQFPYDFGPTFVQSLVSSGGNQAVDAAFKNPPTLDSQIVDPETYVPGVTAPRVTLPPIPKGAHQVLPPSGFGEVPLLEMLGDEVGFNSAWSAIQGWTNDQFDAYRQNGKVCVSIAVLNDGSDSAASLLQTGRVWASHLPSASVARSGSTVDFQACDPGATWKPAVRVDDPYQALAVRSVLMYQLMADGHLSPTKAVCTADEVMSTLGPQKLQDAEQSADPGTPAVQALGAAVGLGVASCG